MHVSKLRIIFKRIVITQIFGRRKRYDKPLVRDQQSAILQQYKHI
eukprot:COSAG01_NODE_47741_length_387_cov_1.111111_1_plen_44_part_10